LFLPEKRFYRLSDANSWILGRCRSLSLASSSACEAVFVVDDS
jgi:hypothetical protein